jgi:hypothetical protein
VSRRALARLATAAAIAATMAVGIAEAQEQVRAHMEGCLAWGGPGPVVVRNDCPRPISLTIMSFGNQQPATIELAPGALYTASFEWNTTGFMFTACPGGFQPSVRFAVENKETIGASLYNCVAGRPTS